MTNIVQIAPEIIPTLFETFSQAKPSILREYGGSGLGLSIIKKIVSLAGGSIAVRSSVGIGSAFMIQRKLRVYGWVVEGEPNSLLNAVPFSRIVDLTELSILQAKTNVQALRSTMFVPPKSRAIAHEPFEIGSPHQPVLNMQTATAKKVVRILLVEDEPINQKLVKKWLQPFCELVIVNNGLEGVNATESAQKDNTPFDLILMVCLFVVVR
jgi:CheY-like chemotaxis protein